MDKCNLDTLPLFRASVVDDESATWLANFPFNHDTPGEPIVGSESLSIVYNELEPGNRIGTHRDGTDEALLILAGTVEVKVEEQTCIAEPNDLALVPAQTPHSVENVGSNKARMIGCFGEGTIESDFDGTVVSNPVVS